MYARKQHQLVYFTSRAVISMFNELFIRIGSFRKNVAALAKVGNSDRLLLQT